MLFNSLDFALFLPIVFILYWFVLSRNLRAQNTLIFVASYVFYGWWDWRFLSLIFFSTLIDYIVGKGLSKYAKSSTRKILLSTSIVVNLGLLGFFKYFNFFLDNLFHAFSFFGQPITLKGLDIVLPVGISFYTFQTLSYSIDVYKKKLEPTNDFIAFAAFVSFFPQLVAGPIERATNLLPQITRKRDLNIFNLKKGIYLIIYGYFLKVFVADTLAPISDELFNHYDNHKGGELILGAVYFSFQIYGDFAGYSSIARGVSLLFGIKLLENFNRPYFARSISDFWNRWHISLNTWFRDYLYIPLGGSKNGFNKQIRNILLVFLVSGLWHGANWTFIAWALLHSMYYFITLVGKRRGKMQMNLKHTFLAPRLFEFFKILSIYSIVTLAWIFFRSPNVHDAIGYLQRISFDFHQYHEYLIVCFLAILIDRYVKSPQFNHLTYPLMVGLILASTITNTPSEFIYFQF